MASSLYSYSYNKIKHLLNLKCDISVEHYIINCDNNKNIYKSAKLQICNSSLNYTNNFEDIYIYIYSEYNNLVYTTYLT